MVRKFPLSNCRKLLFSTLFFFIGYAAVMAQNPIVTENAIAGTAPAQWDISGAGDLNIQGFATDMSVNKGQTVRFKIDVNGGGTYSITIYRLGYYQGNGARLITSLGNFTGVNQPEPNTNTSTGLVDCSNWTESASWAVPSTAVSGVYIAKLTRSTGSSHIIFVVRDDASTSPLLFKTSDATWQAYNGYGGNSLYVGATNYPGGHAAKVSYNRPFITRAGGGGGGAMEDWVFNAEFPMIRFLERNGYNVRYTTDVDMERSTSAITTANCKIFLSVGHDEYWSAAQRTRIENARDAGVHLAFFSGNEVYWKTRWEDNTRTLVCYKEGTIGENVCGGKCDPTAIWTGLWRTGENYDAGSPENKLTGQISWDGTTSTITVPAEYKNLRFWRNTSVAALGTNQTATLTTGSLGYEWDYEQYPETYPSGRITLSSTTFNGKTHKLSLYRHSSGALVFGAGTVQWAWGLDNVHDRGNAPVSQAMQQATVNLFADMGVQPATLMAGLQAASASTDLTAPTCIISSPSNGATLSTGVPVNITGTATEVGGGQLVGVEVSVDGGLSWKPATGTSSWSFSWTPTTAGTGNIRVRGFDDSGNMGVPGSIGSSSNINVTVGGGTTYTVLQGAIPSIPLENDGQAIELGMKFRSTENGTITALRYYKGAGSTGTRTGHLWSSTGTKLAEIAFTGETASGWQQIALPSPVNITAGVTYVVSYHSSSGDYCSSNPSFNNAFVNGPLRGLASGEDGPNGLYIYSAAFAFPTGNYQTSNYFADVVFVPGPVVDNTPPVISSVLPVNGATNVGVATAISAIVSESLSASTVSGTTVALRNPSNVVISATVSYNDATKTITLTPNASLANSTLYTATITGGASGIKDLAGNALASNYTWSFTTAAATDIIPPTVSAVTPLNAATNVPIGTSITVTFNEAMSGGSINTSTIEVRNAANALIPATVVLTQTTQATITPANPLAFGTVYTVLVKSGATGVKDASGNALANNYTWSFTTGSNNCPCTIFQPTDGPITAKENDGSAISLGMKFRSSQSGFITGVRYYKAPGTTATHTGTLWSSTGTKLAEVVFAGESASGWQQQLFAAPYAISANTTYVISYHSTSGDYVSTNPYFTSAVTNGSLRALANGEDGTNGVYLYSATPAFPTSNYQTSNYWVDVVFNTSVAPDETAPVVSSVSPANAAVNVSATSSLLINFNEAMNVSTLNGTTIELRNASNVLIAATVSGAQTQAILTPSAPLAYSSVYTARVKSGASGVKDLAGNALAADYTWTFTTTDPPPPSPLDGAGGPILVVSSTANPFSRFAVEILRAEGLNGFAAKDISAVTATDLNNYDVVVLGEMSLTAAQATIFTNWVNAGGTLVAFRPSTQLSSLLGITKGTGTLTDQYLLVNTASGPGAGIVGETIQFHGAADIYTLSGATSLATLYSSATTATSNPAVTMRSVGSNGGKAIAFTYDLAKSIVYTRQGNPAWAGQKRDGTAGPIRSDDLFYGGTQTNWFDFNKVAIPQADEQQRLLVNIILQGNLHRKPMPRFWFLPRGLKAAVIMTGDDHNSNGTTGRFNQYLTQGPNSPTDVADWKAIRGTSYIWLGTQISNSQAAAFEAQGFEIALHLNTGPGGCQNYTEASYQDDLATQTAQFNANWPSLSASVTGRTHCIAWSDWATQAKVQAQNGIRLDGNYYYWPEAYIQNRPGMFTGSGMPMRFADLDGSLIDCYQVPTQLVDEAGINYSLHINALINKALGPEGYYGVFNAQMHTDTANHNGSNIVVAAAVANGVPVISAKQMLTWLDGRNGSSFGTMTWNNGQLSFPITARSGARNLNAMLPYNASVGSLISLTRNGSVIPFTIQTIKGMQYAFFDVAEGTSTYVASYSVDQTAPVITNVVATPNPDGTATITWTTDEVSDSRVDYGTDAGNLGLNEVNAGIVTSHSITLTGLTPGVTYYFRVTSKDVANNSATAPVLANPAASFNLPGGPCFTDNIVADFTAGTPDANIVVSAQGDGGVILKPVTNEEFTGSTLPAAWVDEIFTNGAAATIGSGLVTVNGSHIYSASSFAPGTSIEYTATYTFDNFQNIGWSFDQAFSDAGWITIGQAFADGNLYIRGSAGGSVNLGAGLLGTAHRYRLQWNANNFEVYIDGATTPVATLNQAVANNMFIQISDVATNAGALSVDWLRVLPYTTAGTFVSRVFDAGSNKSWSDVNWVNTLPTGTSLAISVRTGNTASPDGSWTAYVPIATSGGQVGATSRYIQYKADLASTNNSFTPVLESISISCASVNQAPIVSTHPVTTLTVCVNGSVNLVSAANGAPAPTVQWQSSTNGTTWTDIAGATNASLNFTAVAGDNNKRYRAVWTNAGGTVNSNSTLLTVNAVPATPTITVVNNCNTSVLTAGSFTGSLLWSTAATTNSITVPTAGTYTLTQTVNGCISAVRSAVAAPRPTPALSSALTKSVTSGTSVAYTATSTVTGTTFSWSRAAVTGISNGAASGSGNITESLVNISASPVNVTYVYTLTANGCSSTQNVVVTVNNPAPVCSLTSSTASTFNSTTIPAPRYIWFNSVFDPSSLGSTGVVNFYVTNTTVSFTANSQNYVLSVPNAHIRFASNVSSTTTSFINNTWETQAPLSVTGNIFMGGLAYQVPVNLPGNISNVTWNATVTSDRAGVSIIWKWSAAVYSSFATNSGLTIKGKDGLLGSPYLNLDLAGTPQNFKGNLVSGARGTGGTNYTGTYSSSITVNCAAITGGRSAEPVVTVNNPVSLEKSVSDQELMATKLEVSAMPNPSSNYFNIVIKGTNDGPVTVRVVDVMGRVLERHEKLAPNNVLKLGEGWKAGTYFAEVMQGDQRKMLKIIKAN